MASYQWKLQIDLWKAKLQPFRAQMTTLAKAQWLSDSGTISMLKTYEGHDWLVISAMDVGGKSRNQYMCLHL